ncbi:MAG: glycosyltransferase family 2 protein [Hydrogenoanaerobacterium sp.]
MTAKTLYLVIPCYNEEAVLPEASSRLLAKLQGMIDAGTVTAESRILFVNDGSRDATWSIITQLNAQNKLFAGIKLSRNKGHQNALLAGLMTAMPLCDMAISLDADLQDDIDVIELFVKEYYDGAEIVYGVRSKRDTDTFFKRTSAVGFYKFMKLLGVNVVENHADYRLMSRRALEGLAQFDEVNLFLRGIVPLIGYKSAVVKYERHERFAGESKYPLRKMLAFAFDGISSFSVKPIRFITACGFLIFAVSLLVMLYSLIVWLLGKTVAGWTTIVGSIWMIGGIQLLCLGIIGEYIGKIYGEVKHRPRYIIEDILQ